jgi:dephospho-CoA kinase
MADSLRDSAGFVITGVMAAGKSTVADLLARRFDRGVHVRGDVFRKMIVTGRDPI